MRSQVTVIVPDALIVVDGEPQKIKNFPVHTFHAVQWRDTTGEIEHCDRNKTFGEERYAELVAPFVTLWEAEKVRQVEAQPSSLQVRIAAINAIELEE